MKKHLNPPASTWPSLVSRPSLDWASLRASVQNIINQVRAEGDQALHQLSQKYDNCQLASFKVPESEIRAARTKVEGPLFEALSLARQNIAKFHRVQREPSAEVETSRGVKCWRRSVPIDSVGLYIPGGSAPLFSTVLMLGIPAQLAGCKQVVLCTPPQKDGSVHPAILLAAAECGIEKVFKVGGAQAIAAMAYGTESIPRVDKIFGPGNQYVTAAKQIVSQEGIAIDLPAGPSEVLVIADDTCVPAFVAADLLSQAEHGKDSQVVLATTSQRVFETIEAEISKQLETLPRAEIASASLAHSVLVLFNTLDEAINFSNVYAPEHLILSVRNARAQGEKVRNAGSVFLGNYSPESAGDYCSGTNHTLPTAAAARAWSGVSVDSFVKRITYQEISEDGIFELAPAIQLLAREEGLEAHARAAQVRVQYKGN